MLKVLIAEDNVILADIMEEYLMARGYYVCGIASTVDDAVAIADLHKPDLAVLDYRMARGEYGSQIRARLKDKTSMGILYASGDHLDKKLTQEHGDACIEKPYGMSELVSALEIVQDIRSRKVISSARFPQGFHLLGIPASGTTTHNRRRA